MSHPAIGIGHPVSNLPVPGSCAAHVRPAAPRSHGAVFQILHTPYGFRNSEFQNRESGNRINYGAVRRISLGPP